MHKNVLRFIFEIWRKCGKLQFITIVYMLLFSVKDTEFEDYRIITAYKWKQFLSFR